MVSQTPATFSVAELELKTEAELEALIAKEASSALGNDARFVLGRHMIEGNFPDRIAANQTKGLNYIKTAEKNGHLPALEYKTFYDIRFEKRPDLEKIIKGLETVADKTESHRACNTLAEFYHAKFGKDPKEEGNKERAAQFYARSQAQGCVCGAHWLGVYYMEGFGVRQDLDKAESLLLGAERQGNAQSAYQLFVLYSKFAPKQDVVKAYRFLNKAIRLGVTVFEETDKFFKQHYDQLAPVFVEYRRCPPEMNSRQEIENLHDAYVSELKEGFSAKLSKDRMYQRPAGFVTDQQIWLIGVLVKYFLRTVLHFSHEDFLTSLQVDLGPILGETGLWVLRNYEQRMGDRGLAEKKKRARVAIELISDFLEHGLDNLGKAAKYGLKNKYSPKKMPGQAQSRDKQMIYSWSHYAPQSWFEHTRRLESNEKQARAEGAAVQFKACSYCGAPESQTIKHKVCSQCKQRLYCTADCQKFDWKKGHSKECKQLAAKVKK